MSQQVPAWAVVLAAAVGFALAAALAWLVVARRKGAGPARDAVSLLEGELLAASPPELREYLRDPSVAAREPLVVRWARTAGHLPRERGYEVLLAAVARLERRLDDVHRASVTEDRVVTVVLLVLGGVIGVVASVVTLVAYAWPR